MLRANEHLAESSLGVFSVMSLGLAVMSLCGSCRMLLQCYGQWARLDRSNFSSNQRVNKPTHLTCPGFKVLNKVAVNP